jgi:hypothetical protein
MYDKPATTCLKYQTFLSDSGTKTYLKPILWYFESRSPQPPPPPPPAVLPPTLYGNITLIIGKELYGLLLTILKSKRKTVCLRNHHIF